MALYKNWSEICKIGYKNRLLMLVLASVRIEEDDPVFQGLYVGFPQCFSEAKTDGLFPLSIIRELSQDVAARKGYSGSDDAADFPDSFGVLDDLGVPYILFEVCEPCDQQAGWPLFSPTAVEKTTKQGTVLMWKGQQMVLLENNYNERADEWRLAMAPAACILLDL